MAKNTVIYPGTFDPITFGHIDIIKRASKIFDHVVIAIAKDNAKNPLFTLEERLEIAKKEIIANKLSKKVYAEKFEGLLVDYAKKKNSNVIIRGLRAVSDFEYEFQMFGMNSKLCPDIQTIFLPASESHHFIASRIVKEIVRLGGNVDNFVSKYVAKKLREKINSTKS